MLTKNPAEPSIHTPPKKAFQRHFGVGGARGAVSTAFTVLFLALAGALGFAIHELERQKINYEILFAIHQAESQANLAIERAKQFQGSSRASGETAAFLAGMTASGAKIGSALSSLGDCSPQRTDSSLACDLPPASLAMLRVSAESWAGLHAKLNGAENASLSVAAAAKNYAEEGGKLQIQFSELSRSLRDAVEIRLANVLFFGKLAIAFFGLLVVMLISFLYHRFASPLRMAMDILRIASNSPSGRLINANREDEIGDIISSFNRLSKKTDSIFRLTARLQEARSQTEIVCALGEELRHSIPVEAIALFSLPQDTSKFRLETFYGNPVFSGMDIRIDDPWIASAFSGDQALALSAGMKSPLLDKLTDAGLPGAIAIPIQSPGYGDGLLICATARPRAYDNDSRSKFLNNLSLPITGALEKAVLPKKIAAAAVLGITEAIEFRDPHSHGHLLRVSLYSRAIAEKLRAAPAFQQEISIEYLQDIEMFAAAHGLSRFGLYEPILGRGFESSYREPSLERMLPVVSSEALRRCEDKMQQRGYPRLLETAIQIAESRYENHDGSGYPFGLAGTDIPLAARIVAVADAFDVLTAKRFRAQPRPIEAALAEIKKQSGSIFDPAIVNALTSAISQITKIYERHNSTRQKS